MTYLTDVNLTCGRRVNQQLLCFNADFTLWTRVKRESPYLSFYLFFLVLTTQNLEDLAALVTCMCVRIQNPKSSNREMLCSCQSVASKGFSTANKHRLSVKYFTLHSVEQSRAPDLILLCGAVLISWENPNDSRTVGHFSHKTNAWRKLIQSAL